MLIWDNFDVLIGVVLFCFFKVFKKFLKIFKRFVLWLLIYVNYFRLYEFLKRVLMNS